MELTELNLFSIKVCDKLNFIPESENLSAFKKIFQNYY